ncbi:MAG: nucleotidyl transferase AbiEii/AbiGii toxin family protein [Endomicrobium sp.]|nr:nucleotidyl transferase AbiEii/AbiGii toxin family protein [Endomicrobium sp.]
MLQTQTVKEETFELLKKLMQEKMLTNFYLVGGTALALYLGHRISIDLDLFTQDSFDSVKLSDHLIKKYNFKSDFIEKNTIKGTINNVKVDFITYNYPFVEKTFAENNIRLCSMIDIVAMKLSVIVDDGTRLKDFIDIACLSTRFSLSDMLSAYEKKYKNSNVVAVLKGLTYYDDVNIKEKIICSSGIYKWKKIKKRLYDMMLERDMLFKSLPV